MKPLDVVTFGESMAMFIADNEQPLEEVNHFTKGLAGAETNVAVGLSRLGCQVGWMSKVGKDSFGQYIMDTLNSEGVDLSEVLRDENRPTGFQLKSKVLSGDPKVEYFRKGSAASTLAPCNLNKDYIKNARHLHMTGIPLALSAETREYALEALKTMREAGGTVSFDPNLRPVLWSSEQEMIKTINETAFLADWVLPGKEEAERLTGFSTPTDMADFYLNKGVKLVVIKCGEDGAYIKTADTEFTIPGFQVERVVDTVGAGDGFAVGIISALLEKKPLDEAVRRAHAIGALVVQSPGDMDGLPILSELETFMNTNKVK